MHDGWIAGWIKEWADEMRPGVAVYAGLKPVVIERSAVVRPGFLRLEWSALEGVNDQIQARPDLDTNEWEDLPFTLPGTKGTQGVDLPVVEAPRFYRVIEVD